MHSEQSMSPDAREMGQIPLGNPLNPGKIGVLMARAGVGKTACLTHIAIEHLLRGVPVLHVSVDSSPEKVKAWYYEALKNLFASTGRADPAKVNHQLEPLRFILAYLHQTFSPLKLEQSLESLKDKAKFQPGLVVLDGLDFDQVSRSTLEELRGFAEKYDLALWMSARTHRHKSLANEQGIPYPCNENDDLFDSIVLLDTDSETVRVRMLKHGGQYHPPITEVFLNPQTYLVQRELAKP